MSSDAKVLFGETAKSMTPSNRRRAGLPLEL